MKPFRFEQLPDETILNIISQLSLWDAFAMETTSKRMHGLVRAQQKVQTFVDISFPVKFLLERELDEIVGCTEKLLLTRFGHKLLKIKCSSLDFFSDEAFNKKLSHACPNLLKLCPDSIPAFFAYYGGRTNALEEAVMGKEDVTAAQVQRFFISSPDLKDLTIYSNHGFASDKKSLLKNVVESVTMDNKIDHLFVKLDDDFEEVLQSNLIERLIYKLPHLTHFKISCSFQFLEFEEYEPLEKFFAEITCSKSLELFSYHPMSTTLAALVTSLELESSDAVDLSFALRNFTSLERLEIWFDSCDEQLSQSLVLPETVRELEVSTFTNLSAVSYVHQCIANQGKQLESLYLIYRVRDAPEDPQILFNQLLASLCESSEKLKTLCVIGFTPFRALNAKHLRTYLKTSGRNLERFHVYEQLITLATLELMSVECKSLESLNFSFAVKRDNSRIVQLEKLFKGMANLYEADVKIMKGRSGELASGGTCNYVNHKFVFRRR